MRTLKVIKEDLIIARKAREQTSFLSFLISECESVGKKNGNRESNEDEVQSVLRKTIEANKQSLGGSNDNDLNAEIKYMESLRPKMATREELVVFIDTNCRGIPIGEAMRAVKEQFGTSADMKLASEIVRAQL